MSPDLPILFLIFRTSAAYASLAAREPRIQPITIPMKRTAGMKMKWLAGIYIDFVLRKRSWSAMSWPSMRPARRQSRNT